MQIFKTTVTFIDLDALGFRVDVDTIEYEGKLWLVPEWNDTTDGVWTKPTRIICLEKLPLRKNDPVLSADYELECPMTKAILGGHVPQESTLVFVIVENPDIEIRRGEGKNLH